MEELKVVNGETYSRDVDIKIVPFMLAHEQDRTAKSIKHILARKKAERKNHLRWVSFWCSCALTIGSVLSLMTSMIYIIPAMIGLAYMCLFEAVNKEAFK